MVVNDADQIPVVNGSMVVNGSVASPGRCQPVAKFGGETHS